MNSSTDFTEKGRKSSRTINLNRGLLDGERRLSQAVLISAFKAYRKACLALFDTPPPTPLDHDLYQAELVQIETFLGRPSTFHRMTERAPEDCLAMALKLKVEIAEGAA